jgi:hypothetical protein
MHVPIRPVAMLLAVFLSQAAFAGFKDCMNHLTHGGTEGTPSALTQEERTQLHSYWRSHISEQYPEAVVRAVRMNLVILLANHTQAFYEFVKLCRDPQHKLAADTAEILERFPAFIETQDGVYKAGEHLRELTLGLVNDQDDGMALLPLPRK